MSIDRREDAGDFYLGGKVISTRPVATGDDVKHNDFAGLDVKTNTIPDLREAVRELGRRLGATVVTALAACVASAATVQTVPVNDLDFDANPSIVTNVTFEGLAESSNVYTKAETDAAISQIPPPDFSTDNTELVETIHQTEVDPTVPQWAKAQTKPTYTADEVGATTPADVTAAIREQSLGGIWDVELEVWWTPRMRNGSLTYEATTNVNLNAGN